MVVKCYSQINFEREVNKKLQEGWKLQGFMQLNVVPFSPGIKQYIYSQSLTKED